MNKNITKNQEYMHIMLIFSLALILRAAFLLITINHNSYMFPDSYDYFSLAKNLYFHHVYGSLHQPEIFRAPGYPFFIFLNILIFKILAIKTTLIFQVILDSISAVLVLKISKILFSNFRYSLFAGLIYAVSPLCIIYSCKLLSEILFVFLLLLLIYFCLRFVGKDSNSNNKKYLPFLGIGFLVAATALTRDIFTPVSILFFIYLAFKTKNIKKTIISFAIFVVIIGAWSLRNYEKAGFFGTSSVSSINLYRYSACSVLAKINKISFQEEQSKIDNRQKLFKTQKEEAEYCFKEGLAVFKEHPFLFTYLQIKNSLNSFLPSIGDLLNTFGIQIGNSDTLSIINSSGIVAGVKHYFKGHILLLIWISPLVILLVLCYIFAAVGVCISIASKLSFFSKIEHILFMLLILFFIFAGGAASTPRFRICVEPFLSFYCAYGIFYLANRFKKNKIV